MAGWEVELEGGVGRVLEWCFVRTTTQCSFTAAQTHVVVTEPLLTAKLRVLVVTPALPLGQIGRNSRNGTAGVATVLSLLVGGEIPLKRESGRHERALPSARQ